jgi:hypothetical protein
MSSTPFSESVINLWLLQFLFGAIPWLVLAIGIAVMAILFHRFDKTAKNLQKEPFDKGIKGLPRIFINQSVMEVMIYVLKRLTGLAIFLGSITTYIVAYIIRNKVEMETAKLPDGYLALGEEPSLDFIILCSFMGIAITIYIAISGYYALRRKGQSLLQKSIKTQSAPTLIARLYGRTTLAGIIIFMVGCFPLLAIIMNIIWGVAIFIPLPSSLLTIELPGTEWLLIVMFSVLWVGIMFAMYSPTLILLWRQLMMSLLQYRENSIVHATSVTLMAITLGLFGGLITMGFLYSLGGALYPDMFH